MHFCCRYRKLRRLGSFAALLPALRRGPTASIRRWSLIALLESFDGFDMLK